MTKKWTIWTLLGCLHFVASAQDQDTASWKTTLPGVEIVARRLVAKDTVDIASEISALPIHLGQYLQTHGYGQVQSYGPEGTLNYLRFRGASSDHTTVYWNDIPLNSITLGGVDVSMIPMFFIDGLEHDRMQNQQTRQWNNVSSGIFLNSGASMNANRSKVRVFQSYNSTKNSSSGLEWTLGRTLSKWAKNKTLKNPLNLSASSRVFYQIIENEFKYTDEFQIGRPEKRQRHNDGSNVGFMQHARASFGGHRVSVDGWWQQRYMELPLRMGQVGQSTQNQEDQIYRMSIRYAWEGLRHGAAISYADNRERMVYKDLQQTNGEWLLNSAVQANSRILTTSGHQLLGKYWSIRAKFLGIQQRVDNTNYRDGYLQELMAQTALDLSCKAGRHYWQLGMRREWRQALSKWNWTVSYLFKDYWRAAEMHWQTQLLLSHRFRAPDLNDYYWVPGGNPLLQPEQGLTYEWNVQTDWMLNAHWHLDIKSNLYKTTMEQLIVWAPTSEGFWAPNNVQHVLTTGLDGAINMNYSTQRISLDMKYRGQWNKSTSNDKHMPYMPVWIHSASLQATWNKWSAEVISVYTDRRFTDAENKKILALDSYSLYNLQLARSFEWGHHELTSSLGCINLFDVDYQSVRSIAMPGRYFQIQIMYQFINKNKND